MLCLCYQQLACIIRRDNLSMARKRVRPVRLRAIRASKPGRPGRPPVHQETWSKVSVVLFDRQITQLDRLATDRRRKDGKRLNRAEIIRALIDALLDYEERATYDFTVKLHVRDNHLASASIGAAGAPSG